MYVGWHTYYSYNVVVSDCFKGLSAVLKPTNYNYIGGIGGIQPGKTWHHVWVSLNNSWEMLKIYPDKPPESSKLPFTESSKLTFTSGRFFMNYMLSVEERNDEDASFSWPDDVDTNRCFVVTALENSFYFIAETEEDKQ